MLVRLVVILLSSLPLVAQTICSPTPVWSPCDIVFELTPQDSTAHPNPYLTVQLQAEFRSPRHRTVLMPGFWDGGNRMIIRFAPTEPGDWDFRVSSNIAAWEGKVGKLTATASDAQGFVHRANVHHWATNEGEARRPHLWMGDTLYTFPFIDRPLFEKLVDTRAAQKFNHLRGVILSKADQPQLSFPKPDQPNTEYFRELDQRIRYMNSKGITADLVLAWDQNHLAKWFTTPQQRERYIRFVVARYAPMNITWQGVQEFEEYENGRDVLKYIGELLKRLDAYQHPRSTHTVATSAPLLGDGWMDYVVYQSSDDQIGAVEHQLYPVPFVNTEFAYEDSGAGRTHAHHVDSDTFRKRLWNATMNGQYPTFGNTGTYGGATVDAKYLESPGARAMTVWYEFLSGTRHWELEPYFDVDGGRALALEGIGEEGKEGVEYIVYVEKPGPVEIVVDKRGYDVFWINPITGERIKQKKDFKGDRFTGEPPDNTHDWVLHLSREGKKEGMLRSYKFESRRIIMQEVEVSRTKVPFEITAPSGDSVSAANPGEYGAKITRDTRATRSMMWLWTGEVTARGQGYRVVGTGQQGKLNIPPGLAQGLPATLGIRVFAMNANGKVYSLDKFVDLTK